MNDAAPVGILLQDVSPEKVRWLWPGRIPFGKLTLIDGDPGTGKSVMTTDVAARVSVGRSWPDGSPCEVGGVVICSAEDGLADTVRPRLDAAGADPSRVVALTTIQGADGWERPLSIPQDIPLMERAIERVSAALVVIDPLMAFLSGETNSHKDQDVRRALFPLATMAERTGASVLVVRHLNKAAGANPIYRGGGSIGIIGAARSSFVVAKHPENEDLRVLAGVKSNLCPLPGSLIYGMETASNGAARVVWRGAIAANAQELLKGPVDQEERSALVEAKGFLLTELKDRPMTAKQIKKNAQDAGVAERTLRRAKEELGVVSTKESDGSWTWSLSQKSNKATRDHEHTSGQLGHVGNLAPPKGEDAAYSWEEGQGSQATVEGKCWLSSSRADFQVNEYGEAIF